MNIVRALEVALPELPERIVRSSPPKLDPKVIAKEHIENGRPVILTKVPGSEFVFRFTSLQWSLIQMFDGVRSPAEIAHLFFKETGTSVSEEDVKELASYLQSESEVLYKTPIERNIALQQELRASRKKRSRFHGLDFSDITIKTWNDADRYITWLYPKVRFLFTPWFVWTSLGMFALMGWMWADRLGEIWTDSFGFYNFTSKSGQDLIEFWFLFGAMAAIHETAHGLVGKHFGATVEKMGFTLMYFAPSFFCDATQVWVMGGKWARIATSIAGIWLDLVVCFVATAVWWGTATGMALHDFAYKVMMVTGIGVSILNLNPLIKLDGYLIFSELVAEPALKETSTAYLSSWIRKHLFGLPVEVAYVPRRKRSFYIAYALLSGLYSYSLLSFLMVLTYRILRAFNPEWAFVPALAMGFWVFRSRIKLMRDFLKLLYLDKKERLHRYMKPRSLVVATGALLLVMLIPVWPDFVDAPFVLAPRQTAIVRATVPGTVAEVSVHEGEAVSVGTPLVRLRNLSLESQAARSREELMNATGRATLAGLQYSGFAAAEQERRRRAGDSELMATELSQLSVVSPIAGTVVTPHMEDLGGRSLDEGDFLLQISDSKEMRAEVYLPEFSMHDVRVGQRARLLPEGQVKPSTGTISLISPAARAADGLLPKEQLQGIIAPRFYVATVMLENNGALRPGMTGTAKVLVKKRSLASFGYRFSRDFLQRKIW